MKLYETAQEAEEARKLWSNTPGAQDGGCRYVVLAILNQFAVARTDEFGQLIALTEDHS